jgi:hypothetical protein
MLRWLLGLDSESDVEIPDYTPQSREQWIEGYKRYKEPLMERLAELGWRVGVLEDDYGYGNEIMGVTEVEEKTILVRRRGFNKKATAFLHEVIHAIQVENNTSPLFDGAVMRRLAKKNMPGAADLDPFEREAYYFSECGWETAYNLLTRFCK